LSGLSDKAQKRNPLPKFKNQLPAPLLAPLLSKDYY